MFRRLGEDEARQLVIERGIENARRLFNESFDPALMLAILEKSEAEADAFNRAQRERRCSAGRRSLQSTRGPT